MTEMYESHNNTIQRLAVVETELKSVSKQIEILGNKQEQYHTETLELLGLLKNRVDSVEKEMTHYKGLIGGISLVFAGIGVVVVFFKSWLLHKLGMQ